MCSSNHRRSSGDRTVSSIEPNSIRLYWDEIGEGTTAEDAMLHFRCVPSECYCADCRHQFVVEAGLLPCPLAEASRCAPSTTSTSVWKPSMWRSYPRRACMDEGVLVLESVQGSASTSPASCRAWVSTVRLRLGSEHALTGWVRNTSSGVEIVVDGYPQALESLALGLRARSPPLARIDRVSIEKTPRVVSRPLRSSPLEETSKAFNPCRRCRYLL